MSNKVFIVEYLEDYRDGYTVGVFATPEAIVRYAREYWGEKMAQKFEKEIREVVDWENEGSAHVNDECGFFSINMTKVIK